MEETRLLNLRSGADWIIEPRGVGASRATVRIASSGYGGAVADEISVPRARAAAGILDSTSSEYEVEVERIETICDEHGFIPDLLKIDIEGHEYDTLMAAENFLKRVRPRLHLELHQQMIKERGKDPNELMAMLGRLGYRELFSQRGASTALQDCASPVLRTQLVAS